MVLPRGEASKCVHYSRLFKQQLKCLQIDQMLSASDEKGFSLGNVTLNLNFLLSSGCPV